MKHLKLLLIIGMLAGSAQAFELSENAQHKAKAAGWATVLAANGAIIARTLEQLYGDRNPSNASKVSRAVNAYAMLALWGFSSKYAYDKFKKEYTLAFPKKDLLDEKA